jgi:hypothetical protein
MATAIAWRHTIITHMKQINLAGNSTIIFGELYGEDRLDSIVITISKVLPKIVEQFIFTRADNITQIHYFLEPVVFMLPTLLFHLFLGLVT